MRDELLAAARKWRRSLKLYSHGYPTAEVDERMAAWVGALIGHENVRREVESASRTRDYERTAEMMERANELKFDALKKVARLTEVLDAYLLLLKKLRDSALCENSECYVCKDCGAKIDTVLNMLEGRAP